MNRLALLSLTAVCSGLAAQSNTVVGLDGRLEILDNITYWGRRGPAYPGGEVGMSMRNTMCNPGSVSIPWFAQMAENHPKFGFLITRLSNDRMEQISDRSYCKHAFTSASTSGSCGTCNGIGGNLMGAGCSDTYAAVHNGLRDYLGPADEIDPWLGTWHHIGSYFDQGDPNVGAPGNTDGIQSPIVVGSDEVKNRVTIKEADLQVPGATYYYGIQLIHQGEALANRWDNIKSRGMVATWTGTTWTVANSAVGEAFGSILQHWTGADVNMASNGTDDGRFYVGSKTTPLTGGSYHYEYAIHNVDNSRGGATLRVPIDAGAVASNFTFRDIDQNPLNDWTAARVGNEVVFTAPAGNALRWNTIYNFGFDATFAPGLGAVTIDEADVGPGSLTVAVAAKVPSGATIAQANPVGTGCGGGTCQTSFYEVFSPASSFDLSNTSWTLNLGGGSYGLTPGTGTYVTPSGTTLVLNDDATVGITLPFSLPYPGGTTTALSVCSNGYVSVGNNGTAANPSTASFLAGAPCWCAAWHNFDPTGTSAVKVSSSAAAVIISFTNIPNFGGGGASTFQYQFLPSGTVHVIYKVMATTGNDFMVGFTPGGGQPDPDNWDISANLPAGLALCSSPVLDLELAASARPIAGTTIDLTTSNIPISSVFGFEIYSTTLINPGVDLTILGMPNCELYAGLDYMQLFGILGPTASVQLVVPNVPSLAGAAIATQAALLTPGANAFGFLTTNGIALTIGLN